MSVKMQGSEKKRVLTMIRKRCTPPTSGSSKDSHYRDIIVGGCAFEKRRLANGIHRSKEQRHYTG
jgi:hypothetical protein